MDNKIHFVVNSLDAWGNEEEGYTINQSFPIGEFHVKKGANEKRAFMRFLHKNNISCCRGMCRISFDGFNYTIENRKTGMPLVEAIADI